MDNEAYDRLVFDGARDLAVQFRNNPDAMASYLRVLGGTAEEILAVEDAMVSPEYFEDEYRGEMCDEGVIEALKDILRRIRHFNGR